MTIRTAEEADLEAVRAIAERAYAPYVPRIGTKPAPMIADFAAAWRAGHLHVIEFDGVVRGYIHLYPRGDHLHIENTAVDPQAQGLGLGGRLLAFAEAEAGRQDRNALELYTNEKMTENQSLYPHLGYRETGRRTEDGFARVYYRKELQG